MCARVCVKTLPDRRASAGAASLEKLPRYEARRMRVTANGKRRRDTQVGVFVKAPAVTVLDARPGGLGADRLVAAA